MQPSEELKALCMETKIIGNNIENVTSDFNRLTGTDTTLEQRSYDAFFKVFVAGMLNVMDPNSEFNRKHCEGEDLLKINFKSMRTKVFYDFLENHIVMAVRDNQEQVLWFAAHFPAGSDDKVNMYCYSIISLHEFKKFKLKEDQFIYLGEL